MNLKSLEPFDVTAVPWHSRWLWQCSNGHEAVQWVDDMPYYGGVSNSPCWFCGQRCANNLWPVSN